MGKINRKGFTLVELVATIVLLAIVMGIASYSITTIIKNSKEKDYKLLIENINSAVEEYYIECKYASDINTCDSDSIITLGYLVTNGYLKGNSAIEDGTATLINPKDTDKRNISTCEIKYTYSNGKVNVVAVSATGACPTSCDYNPDAAGC